MGLISNIMVIARVSGYWQEIILGLILIGTLWLDKYLQKKIFAYKLTPPELKKI